MNNNFLIPVWLRNIKKPALDYDWKFPEVEDYTQVELESLKIIQTQAEKYVDDTLKTADTIAARATTLITLLVALLVASMTYAVGKDLEPKLMAASTFCSFYFFGCLVPLVWNGLNGRYKANGIRPDALAYKEFFEGYNQENWQSKSIYNHMIHVYHKKALDNIKENWLRWQVINLTTLALVLLPIWLVIGYFTWF